MFGLRELKPHQQRFDAAEQQKDERGDDVAHADCLMRGRTENHPMRPPGCRQDSLRAATSPVSTIGLGASFVHAVSFQALQIIEQRLHICRR